MSTSMFVMLVAVPVVLGVLVVALALLLRRRFEGTMYAGTGLAEWRKVAAGLAWKDRWALYRANTAGRAAAQELAPLAVQRGEMALACSDVVMSRSSLRKVWRVLGIGALVLTALNISLLVAGEREWHNWMQVFTQGGLAVLWLTMPGLQRRQAIKFRRSVELNRSLVAAHQSGGTG